MFLTSHQQAILSKVMLALAESHAEQEVREKLGLLMLQLLGAQYYASFVWDDARRRFGRCVHIDMDAANLQRYESHFQFHDPITPQLQRHRQAVCVTQVMPQTQLKKTEFFNDFLARDGLYWGINLYAWFDDENLGDMRIWRDRRRENFSQHDVELLNLIRPAFGAALRRCRREAPLATPAATAARAGQPRADAFNALSPREGTVARLVAQGLPDKEVAARLGISVTTVRTHVDHAFRKLGVDNRVMLARRLAP